MNLYLISQSMNNDWDTYDSAVVAAVNYEEAKKIHPGGRKGKWWEDEEYLRYPNWAYSLMDVKVEHVGKAHEPLNLKQGTILCASFRAG